VKKPAPLPDADIAHAIQRHFQDEGVLRSEHVQVAVTQGVAILSGAVSNLMAKEHAVGVTETIRGVRSIVDQVTVAPGARTDEQIASDVRHALQLDIATRSYTIGVTVKDGKVSLSGTASLEASRNSPVPVRMDGLREWTRSTIAVSSWIGPRRTIKSR
jgi:osmotically-inducible protein OsmY